jgi:nephrocystin-3
MTREVFICCKGDLASPACKGFAEVLVDDLVHNHGVESDEIHFFVKPDITLPDKHGAYDDVFEFLLTAFAENGLDRPASLTYNPAYVQDSGYTFAIFLVVDIVYRVALQSIDGPTMDRVAEETAEPPRSESGQNGHLEEGAATPRRRSAAGAGQHRVADAGPGEREAASPMPQGWKTVRVFISSTFRDMHAERDHLVKVVFPELRERMAGRHLYLVDIDLRWGITEQEAEQGKALEICLEEIERSRPFFIGILGERYGSLLGSLPEDADIDHPWLAGHGEHSLTALEITHAVLRNPELARRAFFHFRDPSFIAQIPGTVRADYAAEDGEAASKLRALKEGIRSSGRPVMEDYPCRWDEGEKRVVELDAFGDRVLEDLWDAICAEYPEEAPEPDPLSIEREAHDAFADERSRLHVGREDEAVRLGEYVRGSDRRPALIAGESGCGKSAFLASWSRHYASEHPDDLMLSYFVGASPSSSDYRRLLRTICGELKRELSLEEEVPEEDEKLPETLATFLQMAAHERGRIVLVIDALDQLSLLEGAHGLGWLLDYVPEETRLVVSALEGDCLDALRRHQAEEIMLPPLSAEEQRQIVQTVLGEWRRKLDGDQLAALLGHLGVTNPLYLRVALEELRLFGRFEQLLPQIEHLAAGVAGLFDQVLQRLEEDHGTELAQQAFSLIGSSRYGLSEPELLDLMCRQGEEQLPRALWARLSRGAKAYLVERGELVSFFHRQLAEAVTIRYPERKAAHAKLAAYFADSPLERKLDEYPYQLQQAEDWQALAATLSDLDFLAFARRHERKYEWMGYWRALEGRFEPGDCYQTALDRRIEDEGESQAVARSAGVVGLLLHEMGLYTAALPFADRALAIRERTLGPDHPDVAASLGNLAGLYQDQGDYDRALPYYERALAIDEATPGADHLRVATSLNNLGLLHQAQGDYARALLLFERALAIRERVFGAHHLEVAGSLNNLALACHYLGEHDRALPLYERALAIYERVLGPDHPQVATSLVNLASLLRDEGAFDRSLPLYERALAIDERSLGLNHPDVATSLNNLGLLYHALGNFGRALRFFGRALDIRERAFGAYHPDVATSLNNLALAYRALGHHDRALPLYERALAIYERVLGPDSPDVATSLNNLAGLYREQGDDARALPLFERSLAIRERTLGPDHPDVAQSLNNLAALYQAQGDCDHALACFERALAIRERVLGANHFEVAESLNNLALVYHALGDFARAFPLLQRAAAIADATLGSSNPQAQAIRKNLEALMRASMRP